MTPSEIKSGMKFGKWEVIKFDHVNKHRIKYFLCKCECGNIRPVRGTSLIDGTSRGCSSSCVNSLAGQDFGYWHVLKKDLSRPRYWICECKCGQIKSVYDGSLKNGTTKSCGCYKNEINHKRFEENAKEHIGEVYGKLTITNYELKNKQYYYNCDCECGNKILVLGKNLFNGNTVSCGCINSKANMLMDKILTKLNIALFNEKEELIGLIENNGSQHYSARGTQWNTPERLIYTQRHDYIKQKFAEENHIPLLIIPYQYFNELEKFLITSDFWKIIIKNFND